jgi:hypothetical protein
VQPLAGWRVGALIGEMAFDDRKTTFVFVIRRSGIWFPGRAGNSGQVAGIPRGGKRGRCGFQEWRIVL